MSGVRPHRRHGEVQLDRSHLPTTADTLRWLPGQQTAAFSATDIAACTHQPRQPLHIVRGAAGYEPGVGLGGTVAVSDTGYELLGSLPPSYPEWLGDRSFTRVHNVR